MESVFLVLPFMASYSLSVFLVEANQRWKQEDYWKLHNWKNLEEKVLQHGGGHERHSISHSYSLIEDIKMFLKEELLPDTTWTEKSLLWVCSIYSVALSQISPRPLTAFPDIVFLYLIVVFKQMNAKKHKQTWKPATGTFCPCKVFNDSLGLNEEYSWYAQHTTIQIWGR